MIKFALCVTLGIAGHQTSPVFNSLERRLKGQGMAYPRIGRYAVGGVMIRIAVRVMLRGVKFSPNAAQNIDTVDNAISSALVGIGVGVGLGYVLDTLGD